jgi:hypothetical protein
MKNLPATGRPSIRQRRVHNQARIERADARMRGSTQ